MWFINVLIPSLSCGDKTFLLQHLVCRRTHAGFITSRAFMQENQALNQRLVEMQKSNKEILQMMENLKQLQQNQSRRQKVKKPGFLDKALQVIPVLAEVAANLPKCSVV